MSQVLCIECGKEISDLEKYCHHCGYKRYDDSVEPTESELEALKPIKAKMRRKIYAAYFICVLIIIAAFAFSGWVIYNKYN